MDLYFYTVNDLALCKTSQESCHCEIKEYLTIGEAIGAYKRLSSKVEKSMGITDGCHVLELVKCVHLYPNTEHREDVLASDYRGFPLWAEEPSIASAVDICICQLNLRYIISNNFASPISEYRCLAKELQDKFLWLSATGEKMSAVRWCFIQGKGWSFPSAIGKLTGGYPLVLKYRVDGITEKGEYLYLELAPWEYDLLYLRSKERMKRNNEHKGGPLK